MSPAGDYETLSFVRFLEYYPQNVYPRYLYGVALSAKFCNPLLGCDCSLSYMGIFNYCPTDSSFAALPDRPHQDVSVSEETFSNYRIFSVWIVYLGNWSYNSCTWRIF